MNTERLREIASQIEATGKPHWMTVRELLAAVGHDRRGKHVSRHLRLMLKRARLKCDPDFENTHIDAEIQLTLGPRLGRPPKFPSGITEPEATGDEEEEAEAEDWEIATPAAPQAAAGAVPSEAVETPPPALVPTIVTQAEIEAREVVMTVRQGISAGGKEPPTIRRNEPAFRALSQLNELNVAQLVVTNGARGMVEGIFSWHSYGKAVLAGKRCETVADCLSREFTEVHEDKPLFDAVREVIRYGTVVVRDRSNALCGLVTLRDAAETFVELAEPFLFLGQIENHLRELVERLRLTETELRALVDDRDAARAGQTTRVDDFTLGELIRVLQNQTYWAKLGLNYDRNILLQRLDQVRKIRNKVMHFDADKLPDEAKRYLTDTRRILQDL